ncbi:MAG: glycosyltransferase, partial [Deltaproteobacteria bacterium]|nr:glycosyltransferase [Deltaproteobacteria bacterium]
MNTKQPFISVIIPVHNGSRHIAGCIDALSDSSYQSIEIIVVDDASTDGTAEICKRAGVRV